MKHLDNEVARIDYDESLQSSIARLCLIIKNNPSVLKPCKDIDEDVKTILTSGGFEPYPTVENTTLFYDPQTDCFFKIIHQLKLKKKVVSLFHDKSRAIYEFSEELISKGIKIPGVRAYGLIKEGRRTFFGTTRVEGVRLYDTLIQERGSIPMSGYRKVLDEVVKFHAFGYWLGDAHLAHVFFKDGEVTGFIDIDSIRRNRPYRLKNLAKDIAGLNHPELPIPAEDKKTLIQYYIKNMNISKSRKFRTLLKYYTARRWDA